MINRCEAFLRLTRFQPTRAPGLRTNGTYETHKTYELAHISPISPISPIFSQRSEHTQTKIDPATARPAPPKNPNVNFEPEAVT